MKEVPAPRFRMLRGYAIDPSLSTTLLTMQVNELTYRVPWEPLERRKDRSGASYPVGEYIEIVDYDPASGRFYLPVDLDHSHLLAQDGYAPSVSNPQFHQQFVYAVIMTTIKNFEKALGRKVLWAENMHYPDSSPAEKKRKIVDFRFVKRLRVYPHALRQANAYYDPNRKALLFGYFIASSANPQLQLPGATVFTCLSHDIIAHETTHAILDGVHRRYIRATHPDMRAFHEAFADIVALFQHFSFPEVLRHQIAQTRGDLKKQNMLGQLAQQFGKAIGGYGSLRDAIGEIDNAGNWKPREPDPNLYAIAMECHERGALLVAAIFDAFLNIYQARVQRIIRIATGGTGRLPEGELLPDLVDEMSKTAAKVAGEVLRICIRALDYCPPVDLTFGDYLRALITADFDMVADDAFGYRVAFVEAFQKRGISAPGIKSMAVEDLLFPLNPTKAAEEQKLVKFLRKIKDSIGYLTNRQEVADKTKEWIYGKEWTDAGQKKKEASKLQWLFEKTFRGSKVLSPALTGLLFPGDKAATEKKGLEYGYLTSTIASFVTGNLSLANRVTPHGTIVNHVVITLVQKRGVRFKLEGDDWTVDEESYFVPDDTPKDQWGANHIIFGGGCTLIFDLDTLRLRYAIKKDIDDYDRMIRQFKYEKGMLGGDSHTYFEKKILTELAGPFAFTHSCTVENGDGYGR
jgi:hypothetical protein